MTEVFSNEPLAADLQGQSTTAGKVCVAGVGMIPFAKPGNSEPYHRMGEAAARAALQDAGLAYDAIQQAYVGYVYGDSTSGQKALYGLGMTGVPVFNVNNNCATGSTALFLARQAIASGAADCVLALGFEQMNPGALGTLFNDRPTPFDDFDREVASLVGMPELPLALRYFGGAGLAHMQRYGTPLATFAKVRAKASRHAARNPLALLRKELSVDDVLNAPMLWEGVLTRLMACPPTCGAAAAVLVSERYARRHGLKSDVRISAQAMTTDSPDSLQSHDMMRVVGYGMSQAAAKQVYEQAGIGPKDIHVVEMHDCFAQNELISYEALGLCHEGEAAAFVEVGDNTYGGRVVTNPSGGLLSKGHPLGATGLAQCYELTHQLRGSAGERQVEGARLGLQHNLGLGGACVVTLYEAHHPGFS
ncbi:lipid-transfer protein [Ottowia thiooxydans]|uniref:lipid-transfer protein n=1 Tax=Ottowia thiooxydans TaxID=219182 RepID=UPI0004248EA3|nr:lipid-transfer protein [Ottowia thiooxydans]